MGRAAPVAERLFDGAAIRAVTYRALAGVAFEAEGGSEFAVAIHLYVDLRNI
jgi:hypothetical protein